MSDNSERVQEFNRECSAAENRLAKIEVRDVSVVDVSEDGVTLNEDDLRVLAIIVEEEEQLDPLLGLEYDGVSYQAIMKLMGYENRGSAQYRVDKLVDAGMVERSVVDSLPVMPGGVDPKYLMATSGGRRLVDGLGLLPVLVRERDIEQEFDLLMQDYLDLREDFILAVGRQGMMIREVLDADVGLDEFEFAFDVETERAAKGTMSNLDLSFSLRDEGSIDLLGEMDEVKREMLIDELLDDGSGTDEDTNG